jgi:hypothetical protein
VLETKQTTTMATIGIGGACIGVVDGANKANPPPRPLNFGRNMLHRMVFSRSFDRAW